MRRIVRCVIPMLLLSGLLFGCGRGPSVVSDAEPGTPAGTTASSEVADTPPLSEDGVAANDAGGTESESISGTLPAAVVRTIAPTGGEIVVEDPESPIDGLSIVVPEGAYADATEFGVSCRPFDGEFPANVTALTPTITVENGGAYADELMTVTVPIELPEDHFAMGFFAHEDGSFEGMPLVDLTSDSITVATMHFSDFLVAMIPDALLEVSVDTGFRPGKDDWHFPNYGSAIAPAGHCAGMSVSAMWYYLERHKKGAPALHGMFDNNGGAATPEFWLDDSLAYRLASMVQRDIDWDNKLRKTFNALAELSAPLTWRSFLFSMHVTGEPQYVSVYNTETKGGHALVAYAVDVEKGELLIADPNYGGEPRSIRYVDGKLLGYMSVKSLTDLLTGRFRTYDVIRYNAKSALVPWTTVGQRWQQLDGGHVGETRFPEYWLEVRSNGGANVVLEDGLETSLENLAIDVLSPASKIDVAVWRDGVTLTKTSDYVVPLVPGENLLGVLVHQDVVDSGKTYEDEYVDFQWIRVNRTSETYEVEVEVQVHADIKRVNVPDPSVGYEGETQTHDTPFEKIAIRPTVRATRTGNVIAASWKDVFDAESDGTRSGWAEVEFKEDEKLETIVGFSASETLTLADGTVQWSFASGRTVPSKPAEDGVLLFELRGPAVFESLDEFGHSWVFDSGNTRKATSFSCDEYSVIRITIR